MMNSILSELFSSRAKVSILAILGTQSTPISLRRLSTLCDIPIRSVALAITHLERQNVVYRSTEMNRTLYVLHPAYPYRDLLHDVFCLATKAALRQRATTYTEKAMSVFPYQTAVARLVNRGEESRRD